MNKLFLIYEYPQQFTDNVVLFWIFPIYFMRTMAISCFAKNIIDDFAAGRFIQRTPFFR